MKYFLWKLISKKQLISKTKSSEKGYYFIILQTDVGLTRLLDSHICFCCQSIV